MAEKNNGIKQVSDLDKTKVQAAIDKFGADKVNQTLVDRGVEGAKAPIKTDISSDIQTEEAVAEQVAVQQPTDTPTLDQTPATEKDSQVLIPGVNAPAVDTTPKVDKPKVTKTEEVKTEDEVLIPGVNAPEIVKSQQELQAEQEGFSFKKDNEGIISFTPKNLDEALSLYEKFGTNVNLGDGQFANAKAIYNSFSKYKNAPESVYLQGFKNNEIGVSGETWDRLVNLNGGQPTAAMLAAQKQYDEGIKIDNVNNTINLSNGTDISLNTETTSTTLQQLDTAFTTKMNQLFGDVTTAWNNFKTGNETVTKLNTEVNDLASQMDELNLEKRDILDDVKAQNPNLPLSQQLLIAEDRIDAVDDQLFVLQRDYSNKSSTLQFETQKAESEFEFKQGFVESQMKLVTDLYGVSRGDIIRSEDIIRQDKLLADSITREDKLLADSIKRQDSVTAKEQAYELEYLKKQQEINNQFGLKTVGNRAFEWNTETQKWDEIPELGTEGVTPTGNITQVDFTTPGGTDKIIRVDSTAQSSLEGLIKQFQLEVPGGDQIIIADSFRTKEEQKVLHDKYLAGTGGLAAKPGTSKHESGLAIDVYSNSNLDALTTEQVKVMNDNGWFQTAGANDMGHFEFIGVPGTTIGDLTASQKLAASNLAGGLPGSKAKDAIEARTKLIEEQLMQGKTIDEIEDSLREGAAGLEFTGTAKSAFQNITENVTGEKLTNKQNILESKIAEFGIESQEVKDYFKKIAISSLDATSQKEVRGNELLTQALGDISNDLKTLEENGIDTSILAGTEEEIAGKIGGIANEELRKITTKIQKTIQTYRRAVSGAAFTESESEEYKAIFPSIGKTNTYNSAIIAGLLESTNLTLDGTYGIVMGTNEYNELFKGVTPQGVEQPKDAIDLFIDKLNTTSSIEDDYLNTLFPNLN